ncbi:hypothetical protein [Streptomyces sp. NRRL F-5727]|nr:hypothetical protein [Streptomyces sp. NRRL F-5727]
MTTQPFILRLSPSNASVEVENGVVAVVGRLARVDDATARK